MQEVDVLGYVKAFMTGFTTLDPFHANAYYDRVLANATGDFAKQYHDKHNEILVQIAQAEPTKGTALAAGGGAVGTMTVAPMSWWRPTSRQNLPTESKKSITQIVGWLLLSGKATSGRSAACSR